MGAGQPVRKSPARPAVLLSLAWLAVAVAIVWGFQADWPLMTDGMLAARLDSFGLPAITLAGFGVLWFLWRRLGTRTGGWTGALKITLALCQFVCVSLLLFLIVDLRPVIQIALAGESARHDELRMTSDRQLELRGEIVAGTARRLAELLAVRPIRVLHLNSIGGMVSEANRLARVIRSHDLMTDTRTGCHSACVVAFIAGRERHLHPDARLGFHSVYSEGTDPFYIKAMNQGFADRLGRLGVSAGFRKRMLQTTVEDVWYPEPSELLANHLVDQVTSDGYADSGDPAEMAGSDD